MSKELSFKEHMESLTFSERLEYIKSKLSEYPLINDIWLIKQAERTHDLENTIKALTYELEDARLAIKQTIAMSDDKTAVHHLHGTVKTIESMLGTVYEEMREVEETK